VTATLLPALFGFLTGLSLIVAIGAQNAFVLRLGIEGRNRVIAPVVAICALSDGLLILLGVLGIGAVIEAAPVALVVIRVIGSGFLIVYGLFAARRAIRPGALVATESPRGTPLRTAVTTALALTWLNPHVYLDTVLFLALVVGRRRFRRQLRLVRVARVRGAPAPAGLRPPLGLARARRAHRRRDDRPRPAPRPRSLTRAQETGNAAGSP
jgi:L-lysine exporter family protein LysE/ArgO